MEGPSKPQSSRSDKPDKAALLEPHGVSLDVPSLTSDKRPLAVSYLSTPAYQSPLRHHRRESSRTKIVKETSNAKSHRQSTTPALNPSADVPGVTRKTLSTEDDAKLVFGTVFSLRRMVRQLGGEDDSFLSYRTGEYKLHYFETPTNLKFVMLTDLRVGNMRTVLHQIWSNLFVEYVVKSPLSPLEHPGGVGVANELFEGGLEGFMNSIFAQTDR